MQSQSNGKPTGVPARYAGFVGGVARSVSASDCEATILRDCIGAVTDTGDAIMFGRTTDGGALSVSVYSGGRRAVAYFVDMDSLHQALVELRQSASST